MKYNETLRNVIMRSFNNKKKKKKIKKTLNTKNNRKCGIMLGNIKKKYN